MIYGEMFMNLERNTRRTDDMSKVLFETYLSRIAITKNGTYANFVSTSSATISKEKQNPQSFSLPFGIGFYNTTINESIQGIPVINMETLNQIRTVFLSHYLTEVNRKVYKNELFEFQYQIFKKGYLEPYNYWVLNLGDEAAFEKWKSSNETLWKSFLIWYNNQPFVLDSSAIFHREHYLK